MILLLGEWILEDSPIEMKKNATKEKFNFPYLYDETQIVAKNYDAACTPRAIKNLIS